MDYIEALNLFREVSAKASLDVSGPYFETRNVYRIMKNSVLGDMPMFIGIGPMDSFVFGPREVVQAADRKCFKWIDINGTGTFYVSVYVDGRRVTRNRLTVGGDNPLRKTRINLPRSLKGYSIYIEISGVIDYNGTEIGLDLLPSKDV